MYLLLGGESEASRERQAKLDGVRNRDCDRGSDRRVRGHGLVGSAGAERKRAGSGGNNRGAGLGGAGRPHRPGAHAMRRGRRGRSGGEGRLPAARTEARGGDVPREGEDFPARAVTSGRALTSCGGAERVPAAPARDEASQPPRARPASYEASQPPGARPASGEASQPLWGPAGGGIRRSGLIEPRPISASARRSSNAPATSNRGVQAVEPRP